MKAVLWQKNSAYTISYTIQDIHKSLNKLVGFFDPDETNIIPRSLKYYGIQLINKFQN